MPSLLNTANNNQTAEGVRIVIAAKEKTGKTTFASQAPNALLLPLEIGYGGVNVSKLSMVQTYTDFNDTMNDFIAQAKVGQLPYRTLVFDSATALERLMHAHIIQLDGKPEATMESVLGGYGKGYTYSNQMFDNFLKQCDLLAVYGGINIVITCHVFSSKVQDPTVGEYDSWDLELHSPKNNKNYGKRELISQWADVLGFLYEPIFISKGETMTKAVSKNQGRVLGVSRTPAYNAGNRYGMEGEILISKHNGWNNFATALYNVSGINLVT